MAEKSEKATPKKLRDARKKGQVAKSQDFPSAFTFMVAIWGALLLAHKIYENIGSFLLDSFHVFREGGDLSPLLVQTVSRAVSLILNTTLPLLVIVVFVGVMANFFVVGPLFSMEAMKIDLKRLNPITNLKNKFKLKTLIELIKSVLKITGAIVIIYFTIYHDLWNIVFTASMPAYGAALIFDHFLIKVIIRVGIFFIAIALFDVFYQKSNFAKEMKMEKFEVKQEYKDTEGDPHIKGKRKQFAHEIAYQEGSVSSTKKAKAVVTNPTHLAIALEYNEEAHAAPVVLVKGSGIIAEKIIKEAEKWRIPIVRNVPLAHELYETGVVNQYIPEETFEAIAEILKWLASLEAEED